MRKHFLIAFLFIGATAFSQDINLNNYEYIIVKSKFDFVKKTDKFQTSSLTKFLFNKKGFKAFLDNEELPEEIVKDRCKSLYAEVADASNFIKTKSVIQLKDCANKVVFESEVGTSKKKDFKKSYFESIRNAFKSIEKIPYKFNGYKVESNTTVAKVTSVAKTEVVTEKKTLTKTETVKNNYPVLYAQSITSGFQLVNTKPEVVFILLKTKKANKFIIKDKNGTLSKQDGYWLAEYYSDGDLIEEKYQVKF